MASPGRLPDIELVYRGMRNANWCKHGAVNYKAFLLRRPNDLYPAEDSLSLGRTPQSAVDELSNHFGAARLSCEEVHALPHGLVVREDADNVTKAYMFGLPLFSEEQTLRDIAITVATDLAGISIHVQVEATPA